MNPKTKARRAKGKMVYTLVLVLVLFLMVMFMFDFLYRYAEQNSYEQLHFNTSEIKEDINLQMLSDRENLITMANFASKLYSDGESYELMFRSFEKIGLLENIGILTPGNTFITKVGFSEINSDISFEEEVQKGMYVSGRVKDITYPENEVIRSAVPITSNGTVVGILYGIINPAKIEERYIQKVFSIGARLIIIEGGTGDYLIDTGKKKYGNLTGLASAPFKDDFSYKSMAEDIFSGQSGYVSFKPHTQNEYYYAHYAPTEIADWQIMLLRPEAVVFKGARETGTYFLLMFAAVAGIMLLYILLVLMSERRMVLMNAFASVIRKHLLEFNQQFDSFEEALKNLVEYSNARSAFFADNLGEEYAYIAPAFLNTMLTEPERDYFIDMLLKYSAQNREKHGLDVYTFKLVANKKTKKNFHSFYTFAKKHEIKNVYFTVTMRSNNHVGLLGVINSKKHYVDELLKEISVCFSMAIFNKKHLSNTEEMALTDSLTGVSNRMAYKADIRNIKNIESMTCVYIDVNELHTFNNKYGHAAGDQMLIYVSDVLSKTFPEGDVYRMGGDEFLILVVDLSQEEVECRVRKAVGDIEQMKYHISVGVESGKNAGSVEEMVRLAEKLMYEDKAKYYQMKEQKRNSMLVNREVKTNVTGKKDIDSALAVMSERYVGVYYVSLKENKSSYLVTPDYYSMEQADDEMFSDVIKRYILEIVKPEYHRNLSTLFDFDFIKRQIAEGNTPEFSYVNISGDNMVLTIYPASGTDDDDSYTLWIFERVIEQSGFAATAPLS